MKKIVITRSGYDPRLGRVPDPTLEKSKKTAVKNEPHRRKKMSRSDLVSLLGQGFHTAFRRGADYHPDLMEIHQKISALPDDVWTSVIAFVVDNIPLAARPDVEKPS